MIYGGLHTYSVFDWYAQSLVLDKETFINHISGCVKQQLDVRWYLDIYHAYLVNLAYIFIEKCYLFLYIFFLICYCSMTEMRRCFPINSNNSYCKLQTPVYQSCRLFLNNCRDLFS